MSWATRGRLGWVGVAAATAVLLACHPAGANVRAQALYARGLVPFNSGQWDQAYTLFNQAVSADANDATALYYRGLTQARRGLTDAAIQDIERALKLNANLPHATLDLGIAYFSGGRHTDAKATLERAYQQGNERLTAAFFLGLTHYRLGDEADALKYFTEAKADPELRSAASYYAGLILVKQGQSVTARAEFEQTAREQPHSEIGAAAQQYVVGGVGASVAGSVVPHKPWSVAAGLNVEYDSNVTAGPSGSTTPVNISGKSDGRFVVAAGGKYTLLDSDKLSLQGSYDFSQSMHFSLNQFDLQGHRLGLAVGSRAGVISYGLAGQYNFFALNYQTFYQEALATPWVSVAEGDAAATQAYYRVRGRDFFRKPYDPGRDGINHALGLRQYVALGSPDRILGLGYQYDMENPISDGPMGSAFKYSGHQIDIGVDLPLADVARLQLGYLYRREDYKEFNSGFMTQKRNDDLNQVTIAAARDLTDTVTLTIYYIGILNDSNIVLSNVKVFDYDRHIVSVGVQVAF